MPFLTIRYDENGVPVIEKAKKAIASIESAGSGGYAAVGPKTKKGDRAYGKYQVMGANIPQWTKEVLGRSLTPKEFLSNPAAQDAVFEAKFGANMEKYGPEGAARAWFTGSPTGTGRDILGTSAAQYTNKFNSQFNNDVVSPRMNPMGPTETPLAFATGRWQPQFGDPYKAPPAGAVGSDAPLFQRAGDVIPFGKRSLFPNQGTEMGARPYGGGGGRFGGDLTYRNQAWVNKNVSPDAQAAPPRQATVTPFTSSPSMKPAPSTPVETAPFSVNADPITVNAMQALTPRISAAIKSGQVDRRMLRAWVEAISGAADQAQARQGIAQLSKLLADWGF